MWFSYHIWCGERYLVAIISVTITRVPLTESIVSELVSRLVPALGEKWSNQFWTEYSQKTDCQEHTQENGYHQIHNLSFFLQGKHLGRDHHSITDIWCGRIGYGVVKDFTS